jgi:hypothetical protein
MVALDHEHVDYRAVGTALLRAQDQLIRADYAEDFVPVG